MATFAKSSIAQIALNILILSNLIQWSQSKFLLLVDDPTWISAFQRGLGEYEDVFESSFDFRAVPYKNDSNWEEVCQIIATGITAVLDLTHPVETEIKPQTFFKAKLIPYYKVDVPSDALIKGANALMEAKNASNGFLIFHGENGKFLGIEDVTRGVHLILGHTLIRYAFLDANSMGKLIVEKFDYRIPSGVLLFGTGQEFQEFIKDKYKVVRNRTEWIFMFNSFQAAIPQLNVTFPYLRGYYEAKLCCQLKNSDKKDTPGVATACDPNDCSGDPTEMYLKKLAFILSTSLRQIESPIEKKFTLGCETDNKKTGDANFQKDLSTKLTDNSADLFKLTDDRLSLKSELIFDEFQNKTTNPVGVYDTAKFTQNPNYTFRKRPRYYRIGIVDFKPWTFRDKNGNWAGYCIDLAKGIAEKMKFEYDFVVSEDFGRRNPINGRWDGLTGDLVHGKIDIAIAAYIMTSEREEFIDFVSPYYEQSGLIITMQRPVVKNSLFKFMTVLRAEVWLSIAGATVATGFMLWFLDKFSPYSAQNNPHKYKSFRKFTLKESFWFALTSFTPQGGGEPPKAFSGRTLVAAYWIFVVLMLATFTANLAAFLTVERMQSPIRNLEHLAGQSSVKYSVVDGSTALKFFRNMAAAEETLYQMWRNLTLSAPSSEKQYVVWEYPIREMYIHINSVIEKTGLIPNITSGLEKAEKDPYYAFIHDSAQSRYEVFRNCNLTIIGESFAESPYAIAVAQGNPLQDDISMAILELQTNRFFETLSSRYWSSECPNLGEGESDGISLESLGGVFIATIIGLGIAFISLAIEVFTTARARRKAKIEADNMIKPKFIGPMDFYGTTKKAEAFRKGGFLPEVIN